VPLLPLIPLLPLSASLAALGLGPQCLGSSTRGFAVRLASAATAFVALHAGRPTEQLAAAVSSLSAAATSLAIAMRIRAVSLHPNYRNATVGELCA
jgi:hypothetical protein